MAKTLDDYRDQVHGAPIDMIDAALRACNVVNDEGLRDAARDLVDAYEAFEAALEWREIELG